MNVEFNADEVFEIAVQIEKNGARFYRRAAEIAGNGEDRELLLSLAAMEDSHVKIFESLREELSGPEGTLADFDPHGEAATYLQSMADGQVFDLTADIAVMPTVLAEDYAATTNDYPLVPVFIEPEEYKALEFMPKSLITDRDTFLQWYQIDVGDDDDDIYRIRGVEVYNGREKPAYRSDAFLVP